MLELIFNSSLLDVLCINVGNSSNKWNLNFYNTPPMDWEKVKDNALYSIEFLLQHITLINTLPADAKAEPTNSGLRWKYMNPMFGRAATDMVLYQNYTRMHMQAMFQHALSENVQYLEARANGDGMYVLDDSAPNGHRLVDNSTDGDLWFQTITEELKKFQSDHPEFIGYKEIIQGRRYKNAAANRDTLEGALRLREKFPDLVKGYDLVAEEDQGYSLLFYIDEFANVTSQNRNIPFYFHTAETNWPNDLMTSQHPTDPVSTMDNVYEAIILGSKRVGHGLGFINHPYLMQVLKDRDIAIELNPVSNMLLGYVTDQRHHPGATFIRYGIPTVLAADDPGTMGYDEFTVDWYQAFMAWGLRLSDLRTLALNSLSYSTMSVAEKAVAVSKYQWAWETFISETAKEACSVNLYSPTSKPVVYSIYPKAGPLSSNITVRVFGRNFQSAICHTILCRFGNSETIGRYVYNYMIICDVPEVTGVSTSVDFSVSLDSGQQFISGNNLTFSYLHNTENKPSTMPTSDGNRMKFLTIDYRFNRMRYTR